MNEFLQVVCYMMAVSSKYSELHHSRERQLGGYSSCTFSMICDLTWHIYVYLTHLARALPSKRCHLFQPWASDQRDTMPPPSATPPLASSNGNDSDNNHEPSASSTAAPAADAATAAAALPPAALALAARLFDGARQGNDELLGQALRGGLKANMRNDRGDSLVCCAVSLLSLVLLCVLGFHPSMLWELRPLLYFVFLH